MFSLLASVIPAGIVSIVALYTYARRSTNDLRGDEEADAFSDSYEDERRDSRASSTSSYHSSTSPPPSPTRRISDQARRKIASQVITRKPTPPFQIFSTMNIPPYRPAPPPPHSTVRPSPHPTLSIGTLQMYQKEFGVFYSSSQETFIPVPADLIDVPLYEPIPPTAPRPPRSKFNTYYGREGWGGYTKAQAKKEVVLDKEEQISFFPEWKIEQLGNEEEELYGLPPIPVDELGRIARSAFLKHQSAASTTSRRSSSSSSSSSYSETLPPTPNGSEMLAYDFPSSFKPAPPPHADQDPFVATA